MKQTPLSLIGMILIGFSAVTTRGADGSGWISLFTGINLDGWKASEKPGTFRVENGELVVNGPRSHLYYVGGVANHNFKDFEFKAEVKTWPGSNSGVYFHSTFQEDNWPDKGYEVQVNNSHSDPKRTAGLYDIKDNYDKVAGDGEWFTLYIRVDGRRIVTQVNGKTVSDFTEPADYQAPSNHRERIIDSGTFAIQGHDPGSEVHYRNIFVRPLP